MSEERIIINKKMVLERFDKAGDPLAMWCILKADSEIAGNIAPSEDWRPACFDMHREQIGKCATYEEELWTNPQCIECPYRVSESMINNDNKINKE